MVYALRKSFNIDNNIYIYAVIVDCIVMVELPLHFIDNGVLKELLRQASSK